ncbi:MAG: ABC transporter ATP-binding protein [Eggerthellaceae bacterium]|jgi:oligopeptide/dipeptide ABC transporter ATP-binding protein
MTAEQHTAQPLLSVRNIVKTFGAHGRNVLANNNVSLSLSEGSSLAIVGESGSGKSTLARIICGLERPDSGEVDIAGTPVTGASAKQLRSVYRQLQMVFQNPADSFNPRRKLGHSIIDAAANAGMDRRQALQMVPQLLKEVGLPSTYADRYPSQVSGGECQRAAIARAIAFKPKLLICDECTSALDVLVQSQIIDLLNDLRTSRGISLLFICHDLAIVPRVADNVAVMLAGSVVEYGPAAQVIGYAQHPYTQLMRASVFPTKPHTGWRIPAVTERSAGKAEPADGCPFYSRCGRAKEACAQEMPPSRKTSPGHYVRCWETLD